MRWCGRTLHRPVCTKELDEASSAVKLFAAFMFHELHEDSVSGKSSARWLNALHQAAAANVEGQPELEVLRKHSLDSPSIF